MKIERSTCTSALVLSPVLCCVLFILHTILHLIESNINSTLQCVNENQHHFMFALSCSVIILYCPCFYILSSKLYDALKLDTKVAQRVWHKRTIY